MRGTKLALAVGKRFAVNHGCQVADPTSHVWKQGSRLSTTDLLEQILKGFPSNRKLPL